MQKESQMKIFKFSGLALLCISLLSCNESKYIVCSGYAQGGTYSVKLNAEGVSEAPELIQSKIDSLLLLIDNTLSGYNKSSILSRLNRGEDVQINEMFRDIYSRSYQFWKETGGAVDVAAGPLYDAWGFGFTTDSLPSADSVRAILENCGMGRLPENLDSALKLHPVLNFNAIAQGYSCDIVASYLRSIGVKDMLVDIGEIFCDGHNPNGRSWSIGIDRPFDGNNSPGAELDGLWKSDSSAHGVVTSGNYRKFYIKNGKKYAHTVDPRSGYPVSHNLLSATIIAPDATSADAYATYCMVIGLDEAEEFVLSHPELEAYLIFDDNGSMSEWRSPGF